MTDCPSCSFSGEKFRHHLIENPAHSPDEGNVCHSCGHVSTQLGNHWRLSNDCSYPELSEYQMDVLRGVVMSDGWVARQWKNSCVEIENIQKDYLEYLNNSVFPFIGTSVSVRSTPEESKERSGFNVENVENFNTIYCWRTIRHPQINNFNSWYDSGEKIWPSDLEMNITTFKHLFVGDGSFHQKDEYIKITTVNEMENEEKVINIFDESDIRVNNFRYDSYTDKVDIFFSKSESFRLFELMGDPLPGFEYKWPEEYR